MTVRRVKFTDLFNLQMNLERYTGQMWFVRNIPVMSATWFELLDCTSILLSFQTGIDPDRLQLTYEPEAASIWCQHETSDASHALSEPGTQYMVIDLGGMEHELYDSNKQQLIYMYITVAFSSDCFRNNDYDKVIVFFFRRNSRCICS